MEMITIKIRPKIFQKNHKVLFHQESSFTAFTAGFTIVHFILDTKEAKADTFTKKNARIIRNIFLIFVFNIYSILT
ncbi:MAG: hypothetical protein LBU14_03480 [Candidatus Peribacteria bacterium]|jgi:hypothetical protein|nr:hypothetical protein [Candidatus Peribacteria bacterium]